MGDLCILQILIQMRWIFPPSYSVKMHSETQPIFPAMAEQIFAAVIVYFMRTYWRTDQTKLNNKELLQFFHAVPMRILKKS